MPACLNGDTVASLTLDRVWRITKYGVILLLNNLPLHMKRVNFPTDLCVRSVVSGIQQSKSLLCSVVPPESTLLCVLCVWRVLRLDCPPEALYTVSSLTASPGSSLYPVYVQSACTVPACVSPVTLVYSPTGGLYDTGYTAILYVWRTGHNWQPPTYPDSLLLYRQLVPAQPAKGRRRTMMQTWPTAQYSFYTINVTHKTAHIST